MICNICPRKCGVERPSGFCQMPDDAVVARSALHFYEEPCISGKNGSGTVFFCGCNLRCVFCQNRLISRGNFIGSKTFDDAGLRDLYLHLIAAGAHNINLVTPTHFAPVISRSLTEPLSVPVVWNSSGYECSDTIAGLRGKIQIYLPDLKYSDDTLAVKYSEAPNYFEIAGNALLEMYRQVGRYRLDDNGMMTGGMIIRHLVLPGQNENTRGVIDFIYDNFPRSSVMVSLMGQYTPPRYAGFAEKYPSLAHPLDKEEYEDAADYLQKRHICDGYLQYPEASGEKYVPTFEKIEII